MTRIRRRLTALGGVLCAALLAVVVRSQNPGAAKAPTLVVDTAKGTFAIQTFPDTAPAGVAHVVALAQAGFYNGQRVHRALPGFLVQFGDPQSRDMAARERWGRGAGAASGKAIGVAEISPKQTHRKGAVGLAHLGNPAEADSQIYIVLERRPDLDGRYSVIGQVVEGEEIPAALEIGDTITRVFVRP